MKQIKIFLLVFLLSMSNLFASEQTKFLEWKKNFKKIALQNNISEKTFDTVMSNTKFLPNVIKYDRYQPEFYEDTKTYISKRTSNKKIKIGSKIYLKDLYEKN